jgi:hypothetical protein
MKLRFFFVDPNNHVQQASQGRVLAAWKRRKPWDESTGTRDLRLITVVVDHNQHPVHVYMLKLGLEDSWITNVSRQESVKFIISNERWGGGTRRQRRAWIETLKEFIQGMPADMGTQVAAALDVPVWQLLKAPLAVGGPLPVSLQMGISVKELLLYYDPVQVA